MLALSSPVDRTHGSRSAGAQSGQGGAGGQLSASRRTQPASKSEEAAAVEAQGVFKPPEKSAQPPPSGVLLSLVPMMEFELLPPVERKDTDQRVQSMASTSSNTPEDLFRLLVSLSQASLPRQQLSIPADTQHLASAVGPSAVADSMTPRCGMQNLSGSAVAARLRDLSCPRVRVYVTLHDDCQAMALCRKRGHAGRGLNTDELSMGASLNSAVDTVSFRAAQSNSPASEDDGVPEHRDDVRRTPDNVGSGGVDKQVCVGHLQPDSVEDTEAGPETGSSLSVLPALSEVPRGRIQPDGSVLLSASEYAQIKQLARELKDSVAVYLADQRHQRGEERQLS
jgi:hypothetical protein